MVGLEFVVLLSLLLRVGFNLRLQVMEITCRKLKVLFFQLRSMKCVIWSPDLEQLATRQHMKRFLSFIVDFRIDFDQLARRQHSAVRHTPHLRTPASPESQQNWGTLSLNAVLHSQILLHAPHLFPHLSYSHLVLQLDTLDRQVNLMLRSGFHDSKIRDDALPGKR